MSKIKPQDLKIEYGIPIPPISKFSPVKDAIESMKPGGSILFKEYKKARSFQANLRIRGYENTLRKELGKGFRVWKKINNDFNK